MRIAFISSNRTNAEGGSEELWTKTALYALDQGHEVACVVFDWQKPHRLQNHIKGAGGYLIIRKLRGLHRPIIERIRLKLMHLISTRIQGADYEFKSLRKWKPDVICLSQGGAYDHAYHPTYESLFKSIEVPYFILAHSYSDTGFLPDYQLRRSRKILLGAKQVLLVARRQQQVIQKQLRTNLSNVIIVRNPLNLKRLEKVAFPENEKLLMAMVGNVTIRWKGHDLLLEALSRPQWIKRDWELSIYGVGQDQKELEELACFYGLSDKVIFKGFESNVENLWSHHQVLIMPSRIEAAPLTVCEAMICGRAVLTTDIGDMAEYFEEGVSGFLASAPDEKYINLALERLWARKAELAQMGVSAHDRMRKRYEKSPENELLNILISED